MSETLFISIGVNIIFVFLLDAIVLDLITLMLAYIWVKNFRMGNMQFLAVFIVTWVQNEPSESREKNTQLTSIPRRVMGLHCFYCKLAQFKTINY